MADKILDKMKKGVYFPGRTNIGTLSVDIGTVGSITLLLQSLLLPRVFADARVRLKIKGGTDTKWSTT
jgi:RNA 3'-terminal phosphate cyclase (ATP)